jgi:hypothetical protein
VRITPVLLLAVLLLVLPGTTMAETGAEQASPQLIRPARADQELIDELIRSGSVRTEPPQPGPSQYIRDQITTVLDWLSEKLDLSPGAVEVLAQVITWAGVLLLGTVIGALLVLLIRMVRGRSAQQQLPVDGRLLSLTPEPASIRSPEQCWQELQQSLADNRVAEALAALWWWLARTLTGTAAEASWTTRELLEHWSGHRPAQPELVRLCRRLDSMTYGRHQAPAQAVRELATRLRSTLS